MNSYISYSLLLWCFFSCGLVFAGSPIIYVTPQGNDEWNIFVDSYSVLTLDNRGETWQKEKVIFVERLKNVPYMKEKIWLESYPSLANLKPEDYGRPVDNNFYGNFVLNAGKGIKLLRIYNSTIEPLNSTPYFID